MNYQHSSDYGQVAWFERKLIREGYQNVGAYYSHAVDGYQIFRHHFLLKLLEQNIQNKRSLSVLDVGCGLGDFLNLINRGFVTQRLVGVDFVEPVITIAMKRFPHIDFICDSLPELKKINEEFNLIIASEILYYLDWPGRQAAVERLNDLLEDGGFIFISSTLAPHTFSLESLEELVMPYFTIQGQWIQNSRLYLRMVGILQLAHKLNTTEFSEDWSSFYKIVYRFLHQPIIGPFFSFLNKILIALSTPVLRSRQLPRILTALGDLVGPRWAGSNIIILVQKKG